MEEVTHLDVVVIVTIFFIVRLIYDLMTQFFHLVGQNLGRTHFTSNVANINNKHMGKL